MVSRLWRTLTRPWLGALLSDVRLCRVILIACAVLGAGHMLGYALWPCVFAQITGLPCPGCGMTRAVAALLRGDWSAAMHFHPFAPVFSIFGVLLAVSAMAGLRVRKALAARVSLIEEKSGATTLLMIAVIIFGLLRMGGLCSNSALVKEPPLIRTWIQERMERRSPATTQLNSTHSL